MLPACFCGLISIMDEQAARSTILTEKLVSIRLRNCLTIQIEWNIIYLKTFENEVIYLKWSLTITGDESDVRDLGRIVRMLREATMPEEIEGKYSPFQDFLVQKKEEGETRLELAVEEIQSIIQTDLPPSAQKHDSFWRDRKRNIGAHIVKAGWHIEAIQRDQEHGQIEKIELHLCRGRHGVKGRHHH